MPTNETVCWGLLIVHAVCISVCTTQRLQCGGWGARKQLTNIFCKNVWLSRRDQPKNIIGFTHIPTTHTVFTCTQTRYKKIFIHLHTPHAQNIRFLIFPVSHADFTLSVGQHCAPLYLQPFYKQVVSVTRPFPCAIKKKKKTWSYLVLIIYCSTPALQWYPGALAA